MYSAVPKLADIYATPKPELPDDDLTFLRSMIEKPMPPPDPIDFNFLKNELAKRRPPPVPKPKGIELIEPQTKPSKHVPKYLTCAKSPTTTKRSETRPTTTFAERDEPRPPTNSSKKPDPLYNSVENLYEDSIQPQNPPVEENHGPQNIKKPKKFYGYRYIGDLDGEIGVLSAKIDVDKEKDRNIAAEFADLPYLTNTYKKPVPPVVKKARVKPRDLFTLSISPNSKEAMKQKAQSKLELEQQIIKSLDPVEGDTQLFLQTETGKLLPIVVSRLK